MFFNHQLKEIAARNLGIQLPGLGTQTAKPKAPPAGKGKAPAPKAPPKGKSKAAAPPPKWKGPAPSNDWKANCLVNWKPIREVGRLEGSVWQKLLRKKGVQQVPTGLVDDLNNAFMSKASTEQKPRRSFTQRPSVVRLLPRSKALQADILHAKLVRSGIRNSEQVAWVTKPRLRPEVTPMQNTEEGTEEIAADAPRRLEEEPEKAEEASSEVPQAAKPEEAGPDLSEDSSQKPQEAASDAAPPAERPPEVPPEVSPEVPVSQELSGDVLEALLGLLALVDTDLAAALKNGATQAPAELFLQELLREVTNIEVVRTHVRAALHIARFEEAKSVEVVLLKGIKTVRVVVDSKVIPIFLEGVLLVGNYVNSSSTALSGAVGVTLESLANLAHTRTKQGTQQVNALHFVVGHLQRTHPNLVEMLAEDLEDCRSLQGLDTLALSDMIQGFVSQVQSVEALFQDHASEGSSMPDALEPSRVQRFLSGALPQVQRLTELLQELKQASADLRKWFAEPQERQLVDMISSLGQLREALPVETIVKRSRRKGEKRLQRKNNKPAAAKEETSSTAQGEVTEQGPEGKSESAPADGGPSASAEQAPGSPAKGEDQEAPAAAEAVPPSETEPELQEPQSPKSEPDPWADPLNSLTQALNYLQRKPEEPTSTEPSEADIYEAPLANLEAVLAQFTPAGAAEEMENLRTRRDSALFHFDELDELEILEEQQEQEHLTVLQNVLMRTKPQAQPAASSFAAPMAELQSVLAQLNKH